MLIILYGLTSSSNWLCITIYLGFNCCLIKLSINTLKLFDNKVVLFVIILITILDLIVSNAIFILSCFISWYLIIS